MNRIYATSRKMAVMAGCLVLAACGIRGPLEPAPPLFGSARAQYEAQKRAEEAAKRAEAVARAESEKAAGAKDAAGNSPANGSTRQTRQIPIPADPPTPAGENPRH